MIKAVLLVIFRCLVCAAVMLFFGCVPGLVDMIL